MKEKIVAIMYDFDKTLCTKDMQEYSFIPNLGIDAASFWGAANTLRQIDKMDPVLTYMYLMKKKTDDLGNHLTANYLSNLGNDIELFPGVDNWFERINKYAQKYHIKVEHYIISSGVKEIIVGSKIGKYFKEIYASEFYYDDNGYAVWPKIAINYTNKTQFLIRINKGALDISDDYLINKKMATKERRIPFSNMIYVGDGITDVPCMKLTKENGGYSIAVYTDNNHKVAQDLYDDERINFLAAADYRENMKMDLIVKKIIDEIALHMELDEIAKN